jgi:DNA-binding Lrp family transcriptional regulator
MTTAKDEDLLGLLRLNAREPVASLARKLGVSRTTVQDRLKRLETDGTITGYSVKLGRDVKGQGIRGLVTLAVDTKKLQEVTKVISRMPQVETLFTISGRYDYAAVVRTETSEAMDDLLDSFGELPGVKEIETAVILSTKVDRR